MLPKHNLLEIFKNKEAFSFKQLKASLFFSRVYLSALKESGALARFTARLSHRESLSGDKNASRSGDARIG